MCIRSAACAKPCYSSLDTNWNITMNRILLLLVLASLSACASTLDNNKDERMETGSAGHLDGKAVTEVKTDIPPVVRQVPIIAAPEPAEPLQTFTVVATDLPA